MNHFGQGIQMYASTYNQASQYNAQLKQASQMKEERETVVSLCKEGYASIERWYQKRLGKIRFARKIKALIPRKIKNFLKKYMA